MQYILPIVTPFYPLLGYKMLLKNINYYGLQNPM